MYQFTMESELQPFFTEAKELLKLNKEEINLFDKELDLDEDLYLELFDGGVFAPFTMRKDGELVGYCGFFLFMHNHHKTSLQAKQDVLFIHKDHRGYGRSFIKFCDEKLKDIGVEFVHQCVSSHFDWSLVLEKIGYKKLETIYTRNLWAAHPIQSQNQSTK